MKFINTLILSAVCCFFFMIAEARNDMALFMTTIEIDASGNLVYTDVNGVDDDITIAVDGIFYRISDPNGTLVAGNGTIQAGTDVIVLISSVNESIQMNTRDGDDILTLNFNGGNFIHEIIYNGGSQTTSQGDILVLNGTGNYATITHTFINENNGNVLITGNSTITYTELEPVTDNLNAADRVFTFTGGAETITLAAGGTLDNQIDSTLGEIVDFDNPTNSLTINAGTGDDVINIEGMATGFDANLTVNGDDDADTINFRVNPTDLGSGNLVTASERLNVTANISTTGNITTNSSSRTFINGATVQVSDGTVAITGGTSATTGINFRGVDIFNGIVQATGSGSISIEGSSSNDGVSDNQHGVHVRDNSSVNTQSGTISIIGNGPSSGNTANAGFRVNSSAVVESVDGNITINGTGGNGSGILNTGIQILFGARVQTTGTGTINITGSGGVGTGESNYGILVQTGNVLAAGGGIVMNGFGGSGSSAQYGIAFFEGSTINDSANGAIVINGTGGIGTGRDRGIVFGNTPASSITSTNGNLTLTGIGSNTSSGNNAEGIAMFVGAIVRSTGTGTVTLNGTGGSSATMTSAEGILINNTSTVSANGGGINLRGISGDGSGNNNIGISLTGASTIEELSNGLIDIVATSKTGNANNQGLRITNNSSIQSNGGGISITAQGGTNQDDDAQGILMQNGTIQDLNGGAITINATGGTTTNNDADGILMIGATTTITTSSGAILLNGTATDNTGVNNTGIVFEDDARVVSTSGDIALNGTSPGANFPSINFNISNSGTVTQVQTGGNIILTGTGGDITTRRNATNTLWQGTNITINGVLSPRLLRVSGNLDLGTGDALELTFDGFATPGLDFNQVVVTGMVDVTDATLNLINFTGALEEECNTLILIDNDGTDAIIGNFAGLAEGASINSDGITGTVSYVGGDGNDFVINLDNTPPTISCPSDITLECAQVVTYTLPTASDNCGFATPPTSITGFTVLGTLGNSTYFISDGADTPDNNFAFANANNYNVVTINSVEENDFVRAEAANLGIGSFLIGFNDVSSEGNFAWQSGEAITYTNWNNGEPNDTAGGEDYTAMQTNGAWNDVNTNFSSPLIIEFIDFSGGPVQIAGLPSGATFPAGTTTNTFLIEDTAGNSTSCSFDVTIEEDTSPPIISCPSDITLECAQVVTYTLPTASDNCGFATPPTSITGFTVLGTLGNSTYFISDVADTAANNFAFANANNYNIVTINSAEENIFLRTEATTAGIDGFLIGLNDIVSEGNFVWQSGEAITYTNWSASEPNDAGDGEDYVEIRVNGLWNDASTSFPSRLIIEFIDFSGGPVQIAGLPSGATFPVGTTTNTFLIEDTAGNSASCSFDVTIEEDTSPPIISCPSDITLECSQVVTYTLPTASDNCGFATPPTSVAGFTELGTFGISTYFVSDVADTTANNFAFANANNYNIVTINSPEENIFLRTEATTAGIDGFLIGLNDIVSEGNFVWQSGEATTYTNWEAGEPNDSGAGQDYTIMRTDGSWNDTNANFSSRLIIEFIDFSGGLIQIAGLPSGATFPVGTTTNTFIIKDTGGNSTSCSFNVTITDPLPPTITCPADITVNNDPGVCEAAIIVPLPTLADNCGTGIIPINRVPLNFDNDGELIDTPNTLTGLSSSPEDVNLILTFSGDFNNPGEDFVLTGPDGSTLFNEGRFNPTCVIATETITIPAATWDVWFTTYGTSMTFTLLANSSVDSDQCDTTPINFFELSVPQFGGSILTNDYNGTANASDVYPVGTTTVTWTATDLGGNSTSCTQLITVNDTEPLTITCPAAITVNNDPGLCSAVVMVPAPTFDDNCSLGTNFTAFPAPITPLNFASGTLVDTPTILTGLTTSFEDVTIDIVVNGDFGGTNESFVLNGPDGSQVFAESRLTVDDCETATRSITIPFNTWNSWINTFGADLTFTLLEDDDVNEGFINCDDEYQLTAYIALDSAITFTNDYNGTSDATDTYPVGTTTVTWTVTDASGNTETCSFDVTVNDPDGTCDTITMSAKVFLQGAAINPNMSEENLMRDDLRVAGLLPSTSPYADGLTCDAAVFDIAGNDAIVDWVWIELRDKDDNTIIQEARSALLQRDGDIVDTDGIASISFTTQDDTYFVAIHHRNHLAVMSNTAYNFTTTGLVDFVNNSSGITFGSNAQTTSGMPSGVAAMWCGNANNDTVVQYSGISPDTPNILSEVLNDPGNFLNFPTYSITGYNMNDVNMDGVIQYSGTNPDTPFILQNVLASPANFLGFSTFSIMEQLPENLLQQ
ncbi:MAG: HYR domain-containing protein [Bacteroidota bacterium]